MPRRRGGGSVRGTNQMAVWFVTALSIVVTTLSLSVVVATSSSGRGGGYPMAYSMPVANEPVTDAATTTAAEDRPIPMSLAEQQSVLEMAAHAQKVLAARRANEQQRERSSLFGSPRPTLAKRVNIGGDTITAYALPSDPLARLQHPTAGPGAEPIGLVTRRPPASASGSGSGAPQTALMETSARTHVRGEDEEEEGGGGGEGGIEYGGTKDQAYNLYEQFVPVEPTPLSPSPFVEHPVPKEQNLYPGLLHTRSQLTVAPGLGELKENAGEGVASTTMPWQYRPYIKQERLNRFPEPLVYKSMYAWTPNSPGEGDVSIHDALTKAGKNAIFRPTDWSVKIQQSGATIDIARRGSDRWGVDPQTNIATPQMPPEFYQLAAPTPPMFHSPVPPEPRKGHRAPALNGPDIFPTFIETDTQLSNTNTNTESESIFSPQIIPARRPHVTIIGDVVPLGRSHYQSGAPVPVPVRRAISTAAAEAYYQQLSHQHTAMVHANDQAAVSDWHALSHAIDSAPIDHYHSLQSEMDQHHLDELARYDALHAAYDEHRTATRNEPYHEYDVLHTELYGVPPPPPPAPQSAAGQDESEEMGMGARAEAAEAAEAAANVSAGV